VRRGRPGQRGGQNRPGGGGQGNRPGAPRTRGGSAGARPRAQQPRPDETVEKPRTDDAGVSAAGREQPVIEPTPETTPAPVADAPKSTTRKKQTEDPTKLEQSGNEEKS
jgi:hypothetical protein